MVSDCYCKLDNSDRVLPYSMATTVDSDAEIHDDFIPLGVGVIHKVNGRRHQDDTKFKFYVTQRRWERANNQKL